MTWRELPADCCSASGIVSQPSMLLFSFYSRYILSCPFYSHRADFLVDPSEPDDLGHNAGHARVNAACPK